jgi:hypothetical protein
MSMSKEIVFTNEGDVKRAVKKLLVRHGIHPYGVPLKPDSPVPNGFYFMPSSNEFGRSGTSDFICNLHGRFLAIETKFYPRTATNMQELFIIQTQRVKGHALIITQHNIGHLVTVLEGLDCYASNS